MSLYPNPSNNGNFRISYLLPQNKNGILTIHDLVGKQYYKMDLPQWSTLQDISLPELNAGVYTVTIISDNAQSTKKLVVVR
jgi:hypothetical protein